MREVLDSPLGFRSWLAAKAPEQVVGQTGDGYSCPIARYLDAQGYPDAFVCHEEVEYRSPRLGEPDTYRAAAWQEPFVELVDALGDHVPVTAAAALACLDTVLEAQEAASAAACTGNYQAMPEAGQ